MKLRNLLVAASLIVTGLNCSGPASAQPELKTLVPGTLTVAIPDFPYPGFLDGTDPTAPTGGYYVDMANDLGKRLGLKVAWVPADFTAFISGQFTAYDIAADTFSITPVRLEKFMMTEPVYSYHIGLMTKKGVPVSTRDEIGNLVLGSCGACDTFQFVVDVIKPSKSPRGFDIDITKYDAALSGSVDGALGDLPVILAKVATPKYAGLVAACQFKSPINAAWIMQKNSPIADAVKTALGNAKNEGKFTEWEKANIFPKFGGVDPASIPPCADY
ncbi:polar amino acid transport system substrate-binding protein [Mesorhizobium soli]|uniref:transporter substrate-binding domain-containing protein n=1 Tax=Pseudaminobacter soli (ex Li et al. 2025) TaxID=1295366 RepID=UPI00247623CB|nr:transporter substrate-binding domain-containing protein [Mesorhizobium soli]MDH6232231.1 polar amino acid transport system substrate-binding protein [Mesorhizobium soli]